MVFVNIEVVTQLLHVEDLSDMFDNGDSFDIIYLDLKKRLIRSHIKDSP